MNRFLEIMFNDLKTLDEWYYKGYITLSEYFSIKHKMTDNCQRMVAIENDKKESKVTVEGDKNEFSNNK